MKELLYFECNAGISGDMTVAALLDLGADESVLRETLDSLPVDGFQAEISRVKKAGIDCCSFSVHLDKDHENHDHDMAYLHGSLQEASHVHNHGDAHKNQHDHECTHSHENEYNHKYEYGHEHEHSQEHGHEHNHEHGHSHEHRGLPEIMAILDAGKMTDSARTLAKKIFYILAEAEAKAHAVPLDQVHFHEVGAVDSIVDIVAAAVCLDNLGIQEVAVTKLWEGCGTIRCQHGILPVPVPATANIMEKYGLPVEFMDVQGEFVTPTGAAIAAAVKTTDTLPESCRIKKIGMGAGKRNYERPSILRIMLIEAEMKTSTASDQIYKLESNIDDCTGENLGYVLELLMEAGARDVSYTPIFMKKNRPAWQLNVICKEGDIKNMEEIIFRETTTIGIRRQKMDRTILKREIKIVQTTYGEALVKVCFMDGIVRYYPEYESVTELCRRYDLSYAEVYRAVLQACEK